MQHNKDSEVHPTTADIPDTQVIDFNDTGVIHESLESLVSDRTAVEASSVQNSNNHSQYPLDDDINNIFSNIEKPETAPQEIKKSLSHLQPDDFSDHSSSFSPFSSQSSVGDSADENQLYDRKISFTSDDSTTADITNVIAPSENENDNSKENDDDHNEEQAMNQDYKTPNRSNGTKNRFTEDNRRNIGIDYRKNTVTNVLAVILQYITIVPILTTICAHITVQDYKKKKQAPKSMDRFYQLGNVINILLINAAVTTGFVMGYMQGKLSLLATILTTVSLFVVSMTVLTAISALSYYGFYSIRETNLAHIKSKSWVTETPDAPSPLNECTQDSSLETKIMYNQNDINNPNGRIQAKDTVMLVFFPLTLIAMGIDKIKNAVSTKINQSKAPEQVLNEEQKEI